MLRGDNFRLLPAAYTANLLALQREVDRARGTNENDPERVKCEACAGVGYGKDAIGRKCPCQTCKGWGFKRADSHKP